MATKKRNTKHIVLLPFMAQGHIIPYVSLAKLIIQTYPNTYTITIASTPVNIHNLLNSALPPAINLRSLPFHGEDYGLPPNAENTDSLPYPLILNLLNSTRSLRPHFHRLIADITVKDGCPPVCIIADDAFSWSIDVAREFGVFHAVFVTSSAVGFAVYRKTWLHLPHLVGKGEEEEFGIPDFPDNYRLRRNQLSGHLKVADGSDGWSKFWQVEMPHLITTNGFLLNTAEELETNWLEVVRRITGVPVYPVGPLILDASGSKAQRVGKKTGISVEDCLLWLDNCSPASVIYISFGSQNTIAGSQMMALAEGLESSGVSFLWVVRPPIGFNLKTEFRDEWLPAGFAERTRERGLLIKNWAPQTEILSHKSIAAFLSHCGWNSVMESLSRAVPLVGWPMAAEQFYNSKMLEEEMGVGVEIARGTSEVVDREHVEKVVRDVMVGEKGREMRRKSAEVAEKIGRAVNDNCETRRGSSRIALDEILKKAVTIRRSLGDLKSELSVVHGIE